MKRYAVGSYEETRQFMFRQFSRLTPDQKLDWLSAMNAFVDEANPDRRWKRLGLRVSRPGERRRKRS
jgi:hypothetical protein